MADNKITVDNLPIDYSVQYEKNRSEQEDNILDDADKIRVSVSKDTLDGSIGLEVDKIVSPGKKSAWGGAMPPNLAGYNSKRTFLSNQLSETFGPQEKLDAMMMRIEGIKRRANRKT